MTKKLWETPELIVIVRSQPEEAVLETCKFTKQQGGPTGTGNANCISQGDSGTTFCEEQSIS